MTIADLPGLGRPTVVRRRRKSSRRHQRTPVLGFGSFLLAAGAAAICAYAISTASSGDWASGTTLGYTSITVGALAVVLGAAAVVAGRGRSWGVTAVVLGVAADPLVLLWLLDSLSHL
jgi:hypothetical protein